MKCFALLPSCPNIYCILLSFILLQTFHYFYFSSFPVNIRVIVSKPWHIQNDISLLPSNHVNLCSFPMFLIKKMLISTIHFINLFLLYVLSTFLIYISLFILFSSNLYFLENSELMIRPMALLSKSSIFNITSYFLSNPIFTIISFRYLLSISKSDIFAY